MWVIVLFVIIAATATYYTKMCYGYCRECPILCSTGGGIMSDCGPQTKATISGVEIKCLCECMPDNPTDPALPTAIGGDFVW